MSLAFFNEDQFSALNADIIERRISEHVNYVTPVGLRQLKSQVETQVVTLKSLKANADDDFNKAKITELERDLLYYQHRLDSAILVEKPTDNVTDSPTIAVFGTKVTVEDEDGQPHVFEIVGEDEADMKQNKVSYVSPIARALIGHKVGDNVEWLRPAGNQTLAITDITFTI